MTTSAPYEVFRTLAGFSSNRTWVRSYKSLASAKKLADSLTGNGAVGMVCVNYKPVYTGQR